jgi:hypothetical protein
MPPESDDATDAPDEGAPCLSDGAGGGGSGTPSGRPETERRLAPERAGLDANTGAGAGATLEDGGGTGADAGAGAGAAEEEEWVGPETGVEEF